MDNVTRNILFASYSSFYRHTKQGRKSLQNVFCEIRQNWAFSKWDNNCLQLKHKIFLQERNRIFYAFIRVMIAWSWLIFKGDTGSQVHLKMKSFSENHDLGTDRFNIICNPIWHSLADDSYRHWEHVIKWLAFLVLMLLESSPISFWLELWGKMIVLW